jgi:hypothetical protein
MRRFYDEVGDTPSQEVCCSIVKEYGGCQLKGKLTNGLCMQQLQELAQRFRGGIEPELVGAWFKQQRKKQRKEQKKQEEIRRRHEMEGKVRPVT